MNKKPSSLFTPLLSLVLFFISFLFISTSDADRGIQVTYKDDTGKKQSFLYNKSYALLIGVSNYTNGWPVLPGVLKDIKLVKEGLEKQGFETVVAIDPNRRELEDIFHNFITQYGKHKDNRLLIYFAGHGHTLKLEYGEQMGYIVPVDAPNPNQDKDGFLAKAMDMQQMEVYAKRIRAKHALFLFDSCFSGSIFSLSRAVPENISYKTKKPVRQFITAGSANETVPDESIFRSQFLAALSGEGDSDGDGYLTGVELGEFLQKTVVNYSKGSQHPQYGKIRNPHLDKGDFVFQIKKLARLDPSKKDSPKDHSGQQNQDGMAKQMMDQNKQMMDMQKQLMEILQDERKKREKLETELKEKKAKVNPAEMEQLKQQLERMRQREEEAKKLKKKGVTNQEELNKMKQELAKVRREQEAQAFKLKLEAQQKTKKKAKKKKVPECLDEESMSYGPCEY